jgi:predicted phosphodiesterase
MNIITKRALSGLVFVLAFAVFGAPAFAGILKHPYLIYPGTNTQMEVLWQDDTTETTNTLSWGLDENYGLGSTVESEHHVRGRGRSFTGNSTGSVTVPEYGSSNQHKYTITGLMPNTKYYYKVEDAANGVYGTGSFITAPEDHVKSVRFLAMGDSRSQPFALDSIMQAMRTFYSKPGNEDYQRLTIHNGDWVSTDGESYWTTQWFDPTKTDIVTFTANSPIDGCKGNHDNVKIKDADGNTIGGFSATFPKYFPFPYPNETADTIAPVADSSGNPYYNNLYWSFDYGPVHFTIVDEYSGFAPGSDQYNWLINDLATTRKPWKILVYHEPSYSAGKDADNTAVRALEPIVTQYNVDLIYAGHSHNYARTGAYTLAQANGDQVALNVPHITSGGGGAPVYQPDMTNKGSFPHVITAWPAFEFMTFDVQGKSLTMTAYQVNNVDISAMPSNLSITPIETVVLNHFRDVSSKVSWNISNFAYNDTTKLYEGNLTITNTSKRTIPGTLDVVLDGIVYQQGIGPADNEYSTSTPPITSKIAQNTGLMTNVTVVNATGSNNGEPMIRISTRGIAAGASIVVPLRVSMSAATIPDDGTSGTVVVTPVTLQE